MSSYFVFVVVFILFSVSPLVCTDDSSSQCLIPQKPAHGDYITNDPDRSPGDAVPHTIVAYICEPGYELVGPYNVECTRGRWTKVPHVPECIPHCNIDNKTNIVTCASEKERCSIPRDYDAPALDNRSRLYQMACGIATFSQAIIAGGAPARISEMPWHAAIYTKTSRPYKQICGGTLVSNSVVISAAHCFWNDVHKLLPAANYAVALGKQYRPWNDSHDTPQKFDVQEIKIPPRYHGGTTNFQDDIALLILSKPARFNELVAPACMDFDPELEDAQLKQGNLGKVGGWGLTSEDGNPSQVLKAVEMPYVPVEKCIAESPPHFFSSITSDKICAGYKNGTAVCRGDSGGGLLFPLKKEFHSTRYYLRGVVSTAPTDGHLCNVNAWATFTLISKHERFIQDTLKAVS